MELQPITAIIHIQNGIIVEDGAAPGLHAQLAPLGAAHGRDQDTLFLHFSLSGPLDATGDALNHLTQLFADIFYRTSGSVTAAIRTAVGETNQYLINQNLNEADDVRREGSLTCAVLRGNELFMAQIGETFAYIGHNFGLEPVPVEIPAEEVTPFGRTVGLNVRYYHNWLQVQDTLLLGDPRIAHLPNETFVPALVGKNIHEARDGLVKLLPENSARLIVIEFSADGGAAFLDVDSEAGLTVQSQPKELPIRPKFTPEPSKADEIREQRRAQVATLRPAPQKPTELHGSAEPTVQSNLSEREIAYEPTLQSSVTPPDIAPDPAQTVVSSSLIAEDTPVRGDFNEPEPAIPHSEAFADGYEPITTTTSAAIPAAEPGAIETRARQGASGCLGSLSLLFRRFAQLLTGVSGNMQARQISRSELTTALLISILIPILVATIVGGGYIQWQNRTNLTRVKLEISEELTAARAAVSPEQSRVHYNNVLALAHSADTITASDEDVKRDRDDALLNLDMLDGIVRLTADAAYQYDSGTTLSSIAVGNSEVPSVFVLDSANNNVYQHFAERDYVALSEGDPTAILNNNDAVGTHIAGKVVDIHWRPASVSAARSGLAILDGGGALISYYPDQSDKRAAPLDLAGQWQAPRATTNYDERVYVLDPQKGQIWRYLPKGFGFQINEDNQAIQLDGLDQAVDFAIHEEDGSVIVLYADGRLRRYLNGRLIWDENNLRANGLTNDLVAPTAVKIAANGLRSSIFVLDPASNRLVEIGFGGNVLAQYKALLTNDNTELFSAATDFDIGISPFRIYVAADNLVAIARKPD